VHSWWDKRDEINTGPNTYILFVNAGTKRIEPVGGVEDETSDIKLNLRLQEIADDADSRQTIKRRHHEYGFQ
jgi:hypothetical protein